MINLPLSSAFDTVVYNIFPDKPIRMLGEKGSVTRQFGLDFTITRLILARLFCSSHKFVSFSKKMANMFALALEERDE